ncbi:MAG: cation:proton antiporter [Dehalococcoidia bacterium]
MTHSDAVTLLLLALGVFLAPPVSARLRIPAAIGEILFGAVIVLWVPSLKHLPPFVNFLQKFGFLLVLFLAGLELDTHALLSQGPTRVLRALPFAFAVPVGSMFGAVLLHQPAVLGLIVGTISIGLSTRVLADLRLLRTPFGQSAVFTGGMGEVITIICITFISETTHGLSAFRLAIALGKLVLIFGGGYVVLTLLRDLAWWRPSWFLHLVTSNDSSEIGMRSSLALLVAFVAAATLLNVPDVLAAFIAGQTLGIIFPAREGVEPAQATASLRAKLRSTGFSFFVPIAFITVGLDLDLRALLQPGPLALGLSLTAASGLSRMLALPFLRLQVGWKDATLIGLLLSESLTMKVTVANLGVSMHALSGTTLTPAIAATTVGDIIFSILFKTLVHRRMEQDAAEVAPPALPAGLVATQR